MKELYIFKYGKGKWLFLTIILSIITSIGGIFTAYITGRFIDSATMGNIDQLVQTIMITVIGLSVLFVLGVAFVYAKNNLIYQCNTKIKAATFDASLNSSDEHSIKEQLSLFTNDLKQIETKGFLSEVAIIQNALMFVFALAYGIFLSPLTMLMFVIASCVPIIISQLFSKKIESSSAAWSASNSLYTGKLNDYMKGKDTIVNYNAQASAKKDFSKITTQLENSLKRMNNTVNLSNQTVGSVANLAIFGLAFSFGIYQVIQTNLSIGHFMAIVQVTNYLINPLMMIVSAVNDKKTTAVIFKKIEGLEEKTYNLSGNAPFEIHSIKVSEGGLSIGEKKLFGQLNFELQKGDKLLITGPSGYGKSTLLKALGGFMPFAEGEYLINNQRHSSESIKNSVALIKQDPFIFDDTILFNITMGNPYNQTDLDKVIEQSQLAELIAEKGLGYEVGENGKNLSGGQLQRIEIARGLLAKREIILADEISSALDNETSQKINQMLLRSDSTLIEVSHKVSEDQNSQYQQIINLSQLESV